MIPPSQQNAPERFLVTGAMGCLGAWTIRTLLDQGVNPIAFDISANRSRLRLVVSEDELETVELIRGDITDTELVGRTIAEQGVTHVVHLAALQVPGCRADPMLGARVNVLGTISILEALRAHQPSRIGLSYASSYAVFGRSERYPDGKALDASPPDPGTLYGIYKVTDEHVARIYAQDNQLGSVGLRPAIVYGPGRDQGLTSGATMAMLAAAAGGSFRIPHGGRSVFQFASDVARTFVEAARACGEEAKVFNIGGAHASVPEVIQAIEATVPESTGLISFDDVELPFPQAVDDGGLQRFLGPIEYIPLTDGVARTVTAFRDLLQRGLVSPQAFGL